MVNFNFKSMEECLSAFEEFERSCGIKVKLSDGEEIRLPLGFHFHPTEDQLVINYLIPKALNGQLPNYYIDEISNPFAKNPLQFTNGGRDEDCEYFFSKQSTSFQENYSTSSGHWIHVSNKKLLVTDGDQEVEAYRAKYLFSDCNSQFSGWKMYIYSLSDFKYISKADVNTDEDTWVVIRVFHQQEEMPQYYNFSAEDEEDEEEERYEPEDSEQVSSNIVEDATSQLQQAERVSQTDAGEATPTSTCISNGVSTNGCSSRIR